MRFYLSESIVELLKSHVEVHDDYVWNSKPKTIKDVRISYLICERPYIFRSIKVVDVVDLYLKQSISKSFLEESINKLIEYYDGNTQYYGTLNFPKSRIKENYKLKPILNKIKKAYFQIEKEKAILDFIDLIIKTR